MPYNLTAGQSRSFKWVKDFGPRTGQQTPTARPSNLFFGHDPMAIIALRNVDRVRPHGSCNSRHGTTDQTPRQHGRTSELALLYCIILYQITSRLFSVWFCSTSWHCTSCEQNPTNDPQFNGHEYLVYLIINHLSISINHQNKNKIHSQIFPQLRCQLTQALQKFLRALRLRAKPLQLRLLAPRTVPEATNLLRCFNGETNVLYYINKQI